MKMQRRWEQLSCMELERLYYQLYYECYGKIIPWKFLPKEQLMSSLKLLPNFTEYPPYTLSYLQSLSKTTLRNLCELYYAPSYCQSLTKVQLLTLLVNRFQLEDQELRWWTSSRSELLTSISVNSSTPFFTPFSTRSKVSLVHSLWKFYFFHNRFPLEHSFKESDTVLWTPEQISQQMVPFLMEIP